MSLNESTPNVLVVVVDSFLSVSARGGRVSTRECLLHSLESLPCLLFVSGDTELERNCRYRHQTSN